MQRNEGYSAPGTVIPFQVERFNIGKGMDLKSGVFTSPTNGRYFFSFIAQAGADITQVHLRINGSVIAISDGWSQYSMIPLSATLNLRKDDRLDLFLNIGSIFDGGNHYTQFSGILLEEILDL